MSPTQLTLHRARLLGQYKPTEVRAILRVAQLDRHNARVHHVRQQAAIAKAKPGEVYHVPARHGKGRR
jgi:predicted Zn-ribbon and HTH transcriptional regulator